MIVSPVIVAGKVRPHPTETVSGDAWEAWEHDGRWRVGVVDGLGHGSLAAAAAQAALAALSGSLEEPVTGALARCHSALSGTRGAAVSVADIDVGRGVLTYGGVGNVEARLWRAGDPGHGTRPIVYRGVVGHTMPRLRAFEVELEGDWRLLIHSDGVSSRVDLQELPGEATPQALCDLIVARWGRQTDDATAVVVAPGG